MNPLKEEKKWVQLASEQFSKEVGRIQRGKRSS